MAGALSLPVTSAEYHTTYRCHGMASLRACVFCVDVDVGVRVDMWHADEHREACAVGWVAQSSRAFHAAAFSFVTQPTWPAAFSSGVADSDARHDGCSFWSSALSLW